MRPIKRCPGSGPGAICTVLKANFRLSLSDRVESPNPARIDCDIIHNESARWYWGSQAVGGLSFDHSNHRGTIS
jgi:hypothetical protein